VTDAESRVLAQIEARREASLEQICAAIRQPSVNRTGEGVAAMADRVEAALRELGARTWQSPGAVAPIVEGLLAVGDGLPTRWCARWWRPARPRPTTVSDGGIAAPGKALRRSWPGRRRGSRDAAEQGAGRGRGLQSLHAVETVPVASPSAANVDVWRHSRSTPSVTAATPAGQGGAAPVSSWRSGPLVSARARRGCLRVCGRPLLRVPPRGARRAW